MVLKPMIRNNICINSHPKGCEKSVHNQIKTVKAAFSGGSSAANAATAGTGIPRLALVVGCSTGYGLASRIAAAFGYGTATVGVSFEKAGTETKPGTPGFYNNLAFDAACACRENGAKSGIKSRTLDGDAFSDAAKNAAIAAVKELAAEAGVPAKIDLVIYSLASPVRTDPKTGIMYKSVIKPINTEYSGDTIDMLTGAITRVSAQPATDEEIASTVKVMGGEDWELWIEALAAAGVLAKDARTVAYTYIGPELSWAIYKNGTIGRAKQDLERAAKAINAGGNIRAWVSVNKAVVTRASAVIPIIPFYISCVFKVMKEMNLHEGCIEQIIRLYRERLYTPEAACDSAKTPVDSEGHIRIDDWEMRDDVQKAVAARMKETTEANIFELTDIAGFKHDFLEAHGFDVSGVDYEVDVQTAGL